MRILSLSSIDGDYMKIAKKGIMNCVVLLLSLVVLALSFSDFYTITMTGSIIDDLSGGFLKTTEETRNSLFSVFCTLLPLASFIKWKWARILAIASSVVNILTITVLYPYAIASKSAIGASYSAKLTWIGWIAVGLVFFTLFLLLLNEHYLRRIIKSKEKGGNIE